MKTLVLGVVCLACLLVPSQANAQKKTSPNPVNPPIVEDACSFSVFDYFLCLVDDVGTGVATELFPNPNYGPVPAMPQGPGFPPAALWDTNCDDTCQDMIWNAGWDMPSIMVMD